MSNPYAAKALELIKQGYTVIPLTGKVPLIKGWQNLRDLIPDQIADWERAGYFQNIGMVTGAASGNLVVIDFDGLAAYEAALKVFPDLKDTLTVATGSGNGVHVYYKVDLLPDSMGVLKVPMPDTGEMVNVEIKADGKQVVIPPSIHPDTGRQYVKLIDKPIQRKTDLAAIVAYIKGLKPNDDPQTVETDDKTINPKLLAAVEAHFRARPHKNRGEWIDCSCPNALAHKHGDSTPSFGYNTKSGAGNCFSCKGMNLAQICDFIGIRPADYGGFYEKSEPAAVRIATPLRTYNSNSNTEPPAAVAAIPVITRSSRLKTYSDRLYDYETPRENVPVVFPLPALHSLGGMARVITPGKLIGIVGVSGGGKTSLLETMVDSWLDYGVSSLVWSPEWDADEFIARSAQRYGGVSTDELNLHEIFVHELQNGQPHKVGIELTTRQLEQSAMAIRKLRQWETEVGYLDCPFLTVGHLQASIETTLKALTFKPRVLVIDYVQLFYALETNADMTMYNLLMRIKAVCKAYKLVGVIASQVTKDSTRGQADGQLLDAMAAQYVRDDAFNLFITVNPDRDANGNYLPSAILSAVKNSTKVKGKVRVAVDWNRLLFSTQKHSNQYFGEDEE